MIEHILRRFLEYRSRRLIVVIVTFVIGLLAVWPAVDDYLAVREVGDKLSSSIVTTERTVARLGFFEKRVGQRDLELAQRESEAITDEDARKFRARVVELAREHGCQVRRINLSEARTRKWREKDSPLARTARVGFGKETKFDLRTQQFKLNVTGPLSAITVFLDELSDGREAYIHEYVFTEADATGSQDGRS